MSRRLRAHALLCSWLSVEGARGKAAWLFGPSPLDFIGRAANEGCS